MPAPQHQPNRSQGPGAAPQAPTYNVRDLFAQLEADYGSNGEQMNFGSALIPVFRDAKAQIDPALEITFDQFRQVLGETATFPFVEKALHARPAAVQELVAIVNRVAKP